MQPHNTRRMNPRGQYPGLPDLGSREVEPQVIVVFRVHCRLTIRCPRHHLLMSRGEDSDDKDNSRAIRTIKRRNISKSRSACEDNPVSELINTEFSNFSTNSGATSLAGIQVPHSRPLCWASGQQGGPTWEPSLNILGNRCRFLDPPR